MRRKSKDLKKEGKEFKSNRLNRISSGLNASDIESPKNDENDTLNYIEGDKEGSDGNKSPQFYRSESS